MNTVSNTAFYCAGVRAQDARHAHPICNDRFAMRFMDEQAQSAFAPFIDETMPNISNATRCRIIDDQLRGAIGPGTTIVTIGAGLDTRPYRLDGGNWVEVDETPLLAFKEARLPAAECPNPLRRIAIDFARDSLAEKLSDVPSAGHVIVVIEGVIMYLAPEAIAATLAALKLRFPRHTLLCDLMNRRFFEKFAYRVHAKLAAMGGTFAARPDRPEAIFIEHGYAETGRIPIWRGALELGAVRQRLRLPNWLARLLLDVFVKDLNGYAIHRFQRD